MGRLFDLIEKFWLRWCARAVQWFGIDFEGAFFWFSCVTVSRDFHQFLNVLSIGFEGFSEDVTVLDRPQVIYNPITGEARNPDYFLFTVCSVWKVCSITKSWLKKQILIFYIKLLNLEILIRSCFPFNLVLVLTMSSLEYFCQ